MLEPAVPGVGFDDDAKIQPGMNILVKHVGNEGSPFLKETLHGA